jgi:hypothetical protein
MIEYAANGHYYWDKEMLRDFAHDTADRQGRPLNQAFLALQPASGESVDIFFELLEQNLHQSSESLSGSL